MPSLEYFKDYALDPVLRAKSTGASVMFCVHLGVSETEAGMAIEERVRKGWRHTDPKTQWPEFLSEQNLHDIAAILYPECLRTPKPFQPTC